MGKYNKLQRMLDQDNDGYGLNMYNEKVEDPNATNALNTTIYFDLEDLKNKETQPPYVLTLISKIIKNEPLHTSVSTIKPFLYYEKIRDSLA